MPIVAALLVLLVAVLARADWQTDPAFGARRDAYGPGVHMKATGAPYEERVPGGGRPLEPVRPNTYGPGIGMDATGSPVETHDRDADGE